MTKRAFFVLLGLLVSCLTGASLRASNFPFPQNQAQPVTSYYPSYSNADVTSVYNAWLSAQVTTAGAGGFRRVRRHGDVTLQADSTVSEGIGYGMIIAVYMDDQVLFDDLWRYYNLHLNGGSGLMDWYISADGATVLGSGPASDADQDVAWALCMAIYQWGGTSPRLTSSYSALANALITKIYNTYVDGASKAFGPWGGAGTGTLNVSYMDPAMYRVFAQVTGNTGWLAVVDTCYTALFNSLNATNGNATNGLVPAWSNLAGQPVVAFAGAPTHFQYDSCRTPFRIGKDWYFFGEPRAKQYLDMINGFYVPKGAGNITDGYNLNGTERPQYDTLGGGDTGQSAAFIAPAMMGASCDAANAAFVQTAYDNLKTNTLLIGGPYYDQSWTVMGLLWASGNYLNYLPTPTPTPTPDACQFKVKVNAGGAAQSGFAADKAYAAGSYGYVPAYAGGVGTSGGPITGDPNGGLYLDERYDSSGTGEIRYSFTVPNGPATVTLHWAETYFGTGGQRRMDVYVGATLVENDLDVFTAAGGKNVALTRSYSTTVTGGVLTIRFVTVAANATIHAIEITAGSLCTPTVSPTRTPYYSATPTPSRTPFYSNTPSPSYTPSPTASPSFTALPTPDACAYVQRLNAGGGAFTGAGGLVWAADKAFAAGSYGYVSWAAGTAGTSAGPITGTTDDTLFMSERYGNPVAYRFTLANGPYFVRVRLAETYMDTANNRQVTLLANGATMLNADLFTWAGGKNVARDLTFTVNVSTGRLDLEASSSNNSGTLMAIEVLGLTGCTPTRTPSFTPVVGSPTFTSTVSPTRTATASATLSTTPSATASMTPSASATRSPSASPSASPTLSATATLSPTTTRSATMTTTPSATSSATLSATRSASPTLSPSFSVSPTPVPGSPTHSPTLSPSASATPTASTTASPSATMTSSLTRSATSSITATPSPSSSATKSVTATLTQTLTFTVTRTVTPSISPTFSVTLSATLSFTPVPTGSSPTVTPTQSPTFSHSPTGSVTRSASPSITPTLTVTPSVTLTVTSTFTRTPLSGPATVTATPTVQAAADDAPDIDDFALMPSPWNGSGPLTLFLDLRGRADAVRWRLYTPAMVCVGQGQTGPCPAGWSQVDLSNAWSGQNGGLYYLTLSSEGGGKTRKAAKKGRLFVSR